MCAIDINKKKGEEESSDNEKGTGDKDIGEKRDKKKG